MPETAYKTTDNLFIQTRKMCNEMFPKGLPLPSILIQFHGWILEIQQDLILAHTHYHQNKVADALVILSKREQELGKYLNEVHGKDLYFDELEVRLKNIRANIRKLRSLLVA